MHLFDIGFIPVTVADLVDITLVAALIYAVGGVFKREGLLTLLTFGLVLIALWRVTELFQLELLRTLFRQVLSLAPLALVIIFAPQIRRSMRSWSRVSWLRNLRIGRPAATEEAHEELVAAVEALGHQRMGAILVLLGDTDLSAVQKSGDELNATLSRRLLQSIFNPRSPLHDGAVLLRGTRILAARTVLPISDDPDLPPELGLRHRAALGITEISDAAAIVVSEETGKVAVANAGRLKRNVSKAELVEFLRARRAAVEG